jgi:hypothetical protein
MIVFLPLLLLTTATIAAYLRGGLIRVVFSLAMLAATAASLLLVADWRAATGWLAGPVLATMLISRPSARRRLTFEEITRRAITLGTSVLVALFAASKFPIGENPTVLTTVPWLLSAVGAAWLISSIDAKERAQAQVYLIAAGSALLLMAVPSGLLTAGACGLMALLPSLAARWPLPEGIDGGLRGLLLLAAGALAALALLLGSLSRPTIQDLAISLDGIALLAVALLLVEGALLGLPGRAWVIVPALLTVLATAPGLRWAALAALVATTFGAERAGERFAWLSLFVLALARLFAVVVSQPWSPRAQIVALAGSLLLIAVAAGSSKFGMLALTALALMTLQDTSAASPFLMTRFGWVAGAGALLLCGRALLDRYAGRGEGRLEDTLICGLLLLAVAAHDTLGLGILACVLLLVDLVVTRATPVGAAEAAAFRAMPVLLLARSGWPPSVRFAGVTLAVIAALQTSLVSGLLAALLLLGLKFSPVLRPAASASEHVSAARFWLIAPALSLACGLAPALLLRMLRV